jgi:hypothetical protein
VRNFRITVEEKEATLVDALVVTVNRSSTAVISNSKPANLPQHQVTTAVFRTAIKETNSTAHGQ